MKKASRFLPYDLSTPHAVRFQTFLQKVDKGLEDPVRLYIYGSAAVRLYLTELDLENTGMTDDIDVGEVEPSSTELPNNPDYVDPPLEFRAHPIENWLVHPDWREDTANASDLLGMELLQIETLHPVDLIGMKCQRNLQRDREDCDRLYTELDLKPDVMEARIREAAKYCVLSNREIGEIEFCFEYTTGKSICLDEYRS